jgi:hypothetical protein
MGGSGAWTLHVALLCFLPAGARRLSRENSRCGTLDPAAKVNVKTGEGRHQSTSSVHPTVLWGQHVAWGRVTKRTNFSESCRARAGLRSAEVAGLE